MSSTLTKLSLSVHTINTQAGTIRLKYNTSILPPKAIRDKMEEKCQTALPEVISVDLYTESMTFLVMTEDGLSLDDLTRVAEIVIHILEDFFATMNDDEFAKYLNVLDITEIKNQALYSYSESSPIISTEQF